MNDSWSGFARGPANQQDIKAAQRIAKSVAREKMTSRMSNSALLFEVHRQGRAKLVARGGGPDLAEYQRLAVHGHQVEFAAGAGIVSPENAVAQSPQELLSGALRAGAKPASP